MIRRRGHFPSWGSVSLDTGGANGIDEGLDLAVVAAGSGPIDGRDADRLQALCEEVSDGSCCCDSGRGVASRAAQIGAEFLANQLRRGREDDRDAMGWDGTAGQ